jgi:DNA-binding SARP family transcriptional activator
MRYEILGPMRVVDGASAMSLSARKIEVLMATLLVRADEVVGTRELIREIWGERTADLPIACLHVYVSHLRKFLRRPQAAESPIVTVRRGYSLQLGNDDLDVREFQRLVGRGHALLASGAVEDACAAYERALGLWRGPALDHLCDGPIIGTFVCWIGRARLECVERLVEAGLQLGRHRRLVGYLYEQLEENPLHEAFYRQLMLALYRSGCRADALEVYQTARTALREELGLLPPRALSDLHQSILVGDPRLELDAARRGTATSSGVH